MSIKRMGALSMIAFTIGCSSAVEAPTTSGETTTPASDGAENTGFDVQAIAAANLKADLDLKLIARLRVDKDRMVEWYEPSPGLLVVSEAGSGSVAPVTTAADIYTLSGSELHRKLAPNVPVPEALLRIEQSPDYIRPRPFVKHATRGQPLWGGGPNPAITPGTPAIGDNPAGAADGRVVSGLEPLSGGSTSSGNGGGSPACSAAWWNQNFCSYTPGWDWSMCPTDWGWAWAQCNNEEHSYAATCAKTGNGWLRVQVGGCMGYTDGFCVNPVGGTWSIPQGTYRSYEMVAYTILLVTDDAFWTRSDTNGGTIHFIQLCEHD